MYKRNIGSNMIYKRNFTSIRSLCSCNESLTSTLGIASRFKTSGYQLRQALNYTIDFSISSKRSSSRQCSTHQQSPIRPKSGQWAISTQPSPRLRPTPLQSKVWQTIIWTPTLSSSTLSVKEPQTSSIEPQSKHEHWQKRKMRKRLQFKRSQRQKLHCDLSDSIRTTRHRVSSRWLDRTTTNFCLDPDPTASKDQMGGSKQQNSSGIRWNQQLQDSGIGNLDLT